jgi:hypothetical protein
VSRFLADADDPAAEAALAIAGTHSRGRLRSRCAIIFAEESRPMVPLRAALGHRPDAPGRRRRNFCWIKSAPNPCKRKPPIEAILRAAPPEFRNNKAASKTLVSGNPRLSRAFQKLFQGPMKISPYVVILSAARFSCVDLFGPKPDSRSPKPGARTTSRMLY